MTLDQIKEALKSPEKQMVKIKQKRRHWGRGKLVGLLGKSALVLPAGHKHIAAVTVESISLWKSKQR